MTETAASSVGFKLTDCRLDLAMLGLLDGLLHNGRSDLLVHRGVVMASLVPVPSSAISTC
jgi:hypothetical protein